MYKEVCFCVYVAYPAIVDMAVARLAVDSDY